MSCVNNARLTATLVRLNVPVPTAENGAPPPDIDQEIRLYNTDVTRDHLK